MIQEARFGRGRVYLGTSLEKEVNDLEEWEDGKLTQRAKKILSQARDETLHRGYTCIDTEFILLALLKSKGEVRRLLQSMGVEPEVVLRSMDAILPRSVVGSISVIDPEKITLSLNSATLITSAINEAHRNGREEANEADLLIGAICEGETAASILGHFEIYLMDAREARSKIK